MILHKSNKLLLKGVISILLFTLAAILIFYSIYLHNDKDTLNSIYSIILAFISFYIGESMFNEFSTEVKNKYPKFPFKVEKVIKYNKPVISHVTTDYLRRQHCLCLNCKHLDNGCEVANELLELSIKRDLAVMVTRCPNFEQKL